jgi:hypothetical protein
MNLDPDRSDNSQGGGGGRSGDAVADIAMAAGPQPTSYDSDQDQTPEDKGIEPQLQRSARGGGARGGTL